MKLIFVISCLAIIVISALVSTLVFINYGGNNCDQPPENTCSCFCCHMFNSRGYEACSIFGLITGVIIGIILSYITIRKIK